MFKAGSVELMNQVFTKDHWQENWVIGKVAYAK